MVLAPDLYHGVVTSEPDEARKQVMELDQEAAEDAWTRTLGWFEAHL